MRTGTQTFYEAAVASAVARIVASLDEALDLGALARAANLSTFHFHRIFRGVLGEAPLEMHRRLRLERAASHLLASARPVTVIAFDAGYDTHEAFTRSFHDAYGISPSTFRLVTGKTETCVRPPQTQLAARSGIHFGSTASLQTIRFARGVPDMNVIIEKMPALRLATVAHAGPYNCIAEAFQRLGAIAGSAGLLRNGAMMLAMYYDDPEITPTEQLCSDAALSVPDGLPLPAEVLEKRLPAGRYAHTTHVGPYATLGDAWSRLMGEWLPRSGHRVTDSPSYEVYRNTPADTRPEDLQTDLYIPLV